jgi:DNA-binding response OmpR family regulator
MVLTARLRALLRRGGRERPVVLTVGDLSLDPARHRVCRGEGLVALTPRQFEFLELLMRRHGEVLSKRTILKHVWDFNYGGDPTSWRSTSVSCVSASTSPSADARCARCGWSDTSSSTTG